MFPWLKLDEGSLFTAHSNIHSCNGFCNSECNCASITSCALHSLATLNWQWWCNDIVMMQQYGFVVKFTKKVWRWTSFLILSCLSRVMEVCCMPTTHDCWTCFFYIFFILAIYLNLLFPRINSPICPPLITHSLVWTSHTQSTKNCHHCCNGYRLSCPSWRLLLMQPAILAGVALSIEAPHPIASLFLLLWVGVAVYLVVLATVQQRPCKN